MIKVDSQKQPHCCYGNRRTVVESLSLLFLGPSGGGGKIEGDSQDATPSGVPPEPGGDQRGSAEWQGGEGKRCVIKNSRLCTSAPPHPLPSRRVAQGRVGAARAGWMWKYPLPRHMRAWAPASHPYNPMSDHLSGSNLTSRGPLKRLVGSPEGAFTYDKQFSIPHPPAFPSLRWSRFPAAASLRPRMLTQTGGGLH